MLIVFSGICNGCWFFMVFLCVWSVWESIVVLVCILVLFDLFLWICGLRFSWRRCKLVGILCLIVLWCSMGFWRRLILWLSIILKLWWCIEIGFSCWWRVGYGMFCWLWRRVLLWGIKGVLEWVGRVMVGMIGMRSLVVVVVEGVEIFVDMVWIVLLWV